MLKSSLLEIMRSFSKEDLMRFEDFVKSPYHNKNSNVVKLFASIKKFAPAFDSEKLSKEETWHRIFHAKSYNYGIMKNLIHDMSKIAENFLSHFTSQRSLVYDRNLIEELRQRNLTGLHGRALDKLAAKVNGLSKDEDYYNNKIAIIQEMLYVNIDKKLSDKIKIEIQNHNLKLFMTRLFSNALDLFIEEQRTNIRHSRTTALFFLDFFEKNLEDFRNEEILMIYYHLLKAAINLDDDREFDIARDTVKKFLPLLDYTEKRNFYNAFLAICFKKKEMNPAADKKYVTDVSKLFMEMIQFSLLGDPGSGSIDILIYRNILVWSSQNNEKLILQELIHKYSGKIIAAASFAIENYSNAFLSYVNSDFKKCLEYCARVSFGELWDTVTESFWFKKDIKSLEIRCYYELGLYENLISSGDSFKHFLSNARMMKSASRRRDINFCNQLKELCVMKINNNFTGVRKLQKALLSNDDISSKPWLLEKIEELLAEETRQK